VHELRLIVAITGSSGVILGIKTLEVLKGYKDIETHLLISKSAEKIISLETPYTIEDVKKMADAFYDVVELDAPLSSGSYKTDGMIVIPCSGKTLAGIANGFSSNLILRAAEVTLKERRKMVLAVRESPMNAIHLDNMLKLARLGVLIMPPVLGFYTLPKSLEDIVNYTVGKILDQFGIEHNLFKRWGS
jgi:4-hydroxy-3-polyprenylbenzoate decarboxylase